MRYSWRQGHRGLALAVSFAICVVLGVGCSGSETEASSGDVQLALSSTALGMDVAKAIVTVSKGDGADFAPIVTPLSKGEAGWSALVAGVPAGPGRRFDVAAYDASDAQAFSGSARADIVPGATAAVVVILGSAPGPVFDNSAPVIDYVSVSQALVAPGETVRLDASAHDPDRGDAIWHRWAATCGSFYDAQLLAALWTAPAAAASCQLSLTAGDERGASATVYATIDVR